MKKAVILVVTVCWFITLPIYSIKKDTKLILDELRKLDWVPRSLRYRTNLVKEKTVSLEQKLNGEISDTEVARGLSINIEDLYAWKSAMGSLNVLSLDRPIDETKNQNMYDVIESEEHSDPITQIESEEMKKVLLKAIKNLPEKTRLAITLYYYEKLTFKEIGEILEVSESRISQIHSETMIKLKKEMTKMIYA